MTTNSTGGLDVQPIGRDAVVAAVLTSAAELYAKQGPAATSIREVAAHCGVNHGLVFRHFGTKEQLVAATLEHLGQHIADLATEHGPGDQLQAALDRHSIVMARALLEGFPVDRLQSSFPAVALILERIRPSFDTERGARLAAANAVALQLGWRLFGPFLRASAGLGDLAESDQRAQLRAATRRLVTPVPQHP